MSNESMWLNGVESRNTKFKRVATASSTPLNPLHNFSLKGAISNVR